MHVLIIYENTGNGHKKLAKILAKYLAVKNVKISLATTGDLLEEKSNLLASHWNFLIKRGWVNLADIWLNIIGRIIFLPFYYCMFGNTLFRNLDALKPDIVISTCDVNRMMGSYCQCNNIPFYIFMTSGAMFVDMLHQYATHVSYLRETELVVKSMANTKYFSNEVGPNAAWSSRIFDGLYLLARYTFGYRQTPYFQRYSENLKVRNDLKTAVIGPLRERDYYKSSCYETIMKRYKVPSNGVNVIVSNGGFGGRMVEKIVNCFFEKYQGSRHLNIIAICGTDSKLFKKLKQVKSHGKVNVVPVLKVPSLFELYEIADCSIGRATAGILMDGIVSKTPLLILRKTTMNDYGTLDIVSKYSLGEIAVSLKHLPRLAEKILENKSKYCEAIEVLKNMYQNNNVEKIENKVRKLVFGEKYS